MSHLTFHNGDCVCYPGGMHNSSEPCFPPAANAHFTLIRVLWHLATLPMRTAITFDYMALATQHAV